MRMRLQGRSVRLSSPYSVIHRRRRFEWFFQRILAGRWLTSLCTDIEASRVQPLIATSLFVAVTIGANCRVHFQTFYDQPTQ